MLKQTSGTLSETDKKVLRVMSDRLLVTKGELATALKKELKDVSSSDVSIQRLKDMGYVDAVESMGNCYVVTQKGMRALKE